MDELYEYMRDVISEVHEDEATEAVLDLKHAFQLYHMVCYMKQIKGIIQFQDDLFSERK